MVKIHKSGVVSNAEGMDKLRAEFEQSNCVCLSGLLDPELSSSVIRFMQHGIWKTYVEPGFYSEDDLEPGPADDLLQFVVNWPRFIEVVQEITGCGPFTWFQGRVYRLLPNSGHHDWWHTDFTDGRLVALSVILSPRGYQGGSFQMRKRLSERLIADIAGLGPGDAILFRISEELVHRVTEVRGQEPRTVFAGWFKNGEPSLWVRLQDRINQTRLSSSGYSGTTGE